MMQQEAEGLRLKTASDPQIKGMAEHTGRWDGGTLMFCQTFRGSEGLNCQWPWGWLSEEG